jgi:hypothetical protein
VVVCVGVWVFVLMCVGVCVYLGVCWCVWENTIVPVSAGKHC